MLSDMEFTEGSLPSRVFRRIIDDERLNPMLVASALRNICRPCSICASPSRMTSSST